MFAGIDLGTTYVKLHTGDIFSSGISENLSLMSNILIVEGKQYAVELRHQNAQFDININKGLNKNTRINFLYALFKLAENEYTVFSNVIVGLPCSVWKNTETVEKFKDYLSTKEPITLDFNGQKKTIFVENIDVVPEGACAYFSSDMDCQRFYGRKVLLIDIGALTINTLLYSQDDFVDCHTDEFGILKVYKDMAEAITTSTGENIQFTDMFDILQNELNIKGTKIDIEEIIKPIALNHCANIYKNLKLKWSINTIPYVCMIGAGSITMYKYLKTFIPHAEISQNPQTISAIGMGELAGVRLL